MSVDAKLTPGVGFHLQPNGLWKPEEIPDEVIDSSEFFGNLHIQGYECVVFETPDLDQWAQRVALDLSKIAARVAGLIVSSDVLNEVR